MTTLKVPGTQLREITDDDITGPLSQIKVGPSPSYTDTYDPAQAEISSQHLLDDLNFLRSLIKAIVGGPVWNYIPTSTIVEILASLTNLQSFSQANQFAAGDGVVFGTGSSVVYDSVTHRNIVRTTGSGASYWTVEFVLPSGFMGWAVNPIKIEVRTSDTTQGSMTVTLYKNGVLDAGVNGASVQPTLNDTYETKNLAPVGIFAAGDRILVKVDINGGSLGVTKDVSTLRLEYLI